MSRLHRPVVPSAVRLVVHKGSPFPKLTAPAAAIHLNIPTNDQLRLDRTCNSHQPRIPSARNRRPRPSHRRSPLRPAPAPNATGNTPARWQRPPDKSPLASMLCSTLNAPPRPSTTPSSRYCFLVCPRHSPHQPPLNNPNHSSLTLIHPHPLPLSTGQSESGLSHLLSPLSRVLTPVFRKKHCTQEYVHTPI
jgi:hypothetical protein